MLPYELIKWRKNQGYTQSELGEKLGVTKTCVYRWEAGYRHIPAFLHLALECLERKGDELKAKGMEKKKGREVKK
jgi:DNA-binding XRE family transcriptional regulator